jgi:3-oxoacyl-[acyl-carrier-protein] synthase II
MALAREVWITGIGLTSSLGEGLDAHWQALAEAENPRPVIDRDFAPPFPVHPMVPLDLGKQIPKRSDQRQMEAWQRLGTYSAGLALADAGIAGNKEILDRTHSVVAADGGERDVAADGAILQDLPGGQARDVVLNERLSNDLRPTLFLAQLPNLLGGNISIVHNVNGSSRTFMGEESAGVSATEVAWRRIRAGQGDIFLVGGANVAERKDAIMNCALGGILWTGESMSVWARQDKGGGAILGSIGAFLVLEAREHAEARGRRPYAQLAEVRNDRSRRRPGEAAANAARQFDEILADADGQPAAVLSGATGTGPATGEEQRLFAGLIDAGRVSTLRGIATMLGAGSGATFPAATGLAALALSRKGFYKPVDESGFEQPFAGAPERIIVTTWGFWRGEGMGLVLPVK